MQTLKILAYAIITLYFLVALLLYIFQQKLIFYPGKMAKNTNLNLASYQHEVFLETRDNETIHALYCEGTRPEVILYFHGNAGDLSGWKFATEDFTTLGYAVLIIDYRSYGKSTGQLSEQGMYTDGEAAYEYLTKELHVAPKNILVYGRSIGTGVAVEIATRYPVRGLVLESAYTSLGTLANEKVPFFFPSLYLRFRFNNLKKIAALTCPVILLHGTQDELIPAEHSQRLVEAIKNKKKLILVKGGGHNDLSGFPEYARFLQEDLPNFFH
ncbi:alpha/beta hydrolase [Parachryseolinea silvisoli]|uniref:alpha/beta hydrolase n=1 Tax=Parachryseolinea silvisoli TaxID=2873601 RepID=UPI002265F94D|nr:alpha/beta hydrolase [Parachryseolinea silvisoli]MCD9015803.1 alpha/beta hydrolase [Parachryseolinea silvisoli]